MKISFIGNCHADVLSRVLKYAYSDDPSLEIRHFRSYSDLIDEERTFIADSKLVVRQTADFSTAAGKIDFGRALVVPFPLVTGQFLWPFNTRDHPQNKMSVGDSRDSNFFVSTVTDWQVIRLMSSRNINQKSECNEIESLLDDYLALDYAKLTNLDRLFELSRAKMRQATEMVGYDLWAIVERDFRTLPAFVTPLHPADHIMLALCEEVLPRCGFPIDKKTITTAFHEIYDGDYMFAYGAPIHPSVARHFGLNIGGNTPVFRFNCDGFINARDFARRIVMHDAHQPVREALSMLHKGATGDSVIASLEELAPKQAENPMFFLHYGNLLFRLGRHEDALQQFAIGLREAPGHVGLDRKITAALDALGMTKTPVALELAAPVGFGNKALGRMLVRGNWNLLIDDGAAWIEGYNASLQFRLASGGVATGRSLELVFKTRAFSRLKPMKVRVFANGREVGHWRFEGDTDTQTLRLDAVISSVPRITLSFHVDHPVRPVDLGISGDIRSFGICISELLIRQI
jgi:hypothetical protein